MRLSTQDIEKLLAGNKLSAGVANQLTLAKQASQQQRKDSARVLPVAPESKGEATVRIALMHAFGDWFEGGEVVCEFQPFISRRYRADFALPRYKIYVEVDGWAHHGEHLQDHHSDRERGLFFSQYNWLPFRLSHKQSTQTPHILVDAISAAMTRRTPSCRVDVDVQRTRHQSGTWTHLSCGHDDSFGNSDQIGSDSGR